MSDVLYMCLHVVKLSSFLREVIRDMHQKINRRLGHVACATIAKPCVRIHVTYCIHPGSTHAWQHVSRERASGLVCDLTCVLFDTRSFGRNRGTAS